MIKGKRKLILWKQLVEDGYARWAEDLQQQGWRPILITIMFDHMEASEAFRLRQMQAATTRLYARHVTRVCRCPNASSSHAWGERRPIWFCSPDLPVFKRAKTILADLIVNDGLHIHVVAFYPLWTRLREAPEEHWKRHHDAYVAAVEGISRIDVRRISSDVGYVTGYARKTVALGRLFEDTSFVLPRTSSELIADIDWSPSNDRQRTGRRRKLVI